MSHVTIVAEAGVNHNGSLDLALRLVEAAAEVGADVVKFQTFRAEALATLSAPKAEYQKQSTGAEQSQYEMLKALELSRAAHETLVRHCAARNIEFLSTPFDLESLSYLTDELGLQRIKVGSGDMTNAPLLFAAARSGRDVVLSTGMAILEEVGEALGALAYGYAGGKTPRRAAFAQALLEHQDLLRDKVTLLQCTTEYPAAPEAINLRAMDTLADAFGLPVGLSDHSDTTAVPVGAVGRGAVMIEKHLTLDRSLPGPDHGASLEPEDFARMVADIRAVERALGDGVKMPAKAELGNIAVARKSLIAARAIKAGERLTSENLAIKRPGGGLPPAAYWEILGRPADRDYDEEEQFSTAMLARAEGVSE